MSPIAAIEITPVAVGAHPLGAATAAFGLVLCAPESGADEPPNSIGGSELMALRPPEHEAVASSATTARAANFVIEGSS